MLLSAPGFVPLIAPAAPVEGEAWWFVFRGNTILVRRDPARVALPFVAHPQALGLDPLRTQYLGTLDGRHCFSAECPEDAEPPDDLHFAGLRSLFGVIDDATFLLAGRAVQIVDWDRSHRFCGRCGTPTERKENERSRACPSCGQTHYPRLAPVAMALVRRGRELLLARSPHFPPNMMSALAGFVEPGESLEDCLIREVHEEVGVVVNNLRYFSSQPWPFPHSLMIAFTADYRGGTVAVDGEEIKEARFFRADQLPRIPPRLSIARRLIDAWVREVTGHDAPQP
jgi:NAD+ diphosphatase